MSSSSSSPVGSGTRYRHIRSLLGTCLLSSFPACISGCVWAARPEILAINAGWLIAIGYALFLAALYAAFIVDRQLKKTSTLSCKIVAVAVFLVTMATAILGHAFSPKTDLVGALYFPMPFVYYLIVLQLGRRSQQESWNWSELSYYGVCLFLIPPLLRALNDYVVVREADLSEIWTCLFRVTDTINWICLGFRGLLRPIMKQNQDPLESSA